MTHAIYQKKTLCRGNFLVKCKIVIIKPVLGKKAQKKQKVPSLLDFGIFTFIIWKQKHKKLLVKKIKVALPEHCAIKS